MMKHRDPYDEDFDEEEERIRHRDSIEWRFIGALWVFDVIGVAVILNLIL